MDSTCTAMPALAIQELQVVLNMCTLWTHSQALWIRTWPVHAAQSGCGYAVQGELLTGSGLLGREVVTFKSPSTELKIAVGHWSIYDQMRELTNQMAKY